ncbi:hypothetical protein [Stieleria mannarensis]|uniref:hypothetical protein n=1 Tax=Stieleria mannarensis TaxID=2755585 RepID=UPI00160495FB|nr:hypothetical protein [Rhodopirellula sp. JC639]
MTTGSDRSRSQVVGVLFGKQHLHGCRASTTMFGSVRYEYASVEVQSDDLGQSLAQLLDTLDVADAPAPIAAAIPTSECYFATRPINSGGGNASPRTLLRESLRSTTAKLDQLAIDVLNWQAHRRQLVSIVAAPRDRIELIRETIAASRHSLQRLEPAANALISAAVENERKERRDRLVTRVFLGDTSLLAVMTKGTRAIHWQSIPLPQGDEGTGIVSIVRSVEAAYAACGLETPPEAVSIYGRRELQSLIDRQWLSHNLPSDFRWLDAPSMKPEHIARACADGFLADDEDEFDFVREYREPLKLHRVVPYKEIALYLLAACALAMVLHDRLKQAEANHVALVSSAPAMISDGSNPRPERDRLNARASAVSTFMDKRIRWSPMLGQITAVLPEGTRLTGIRGSATMTQKRKRAVKTAPTTLILQAECVLDDDGQLPASVSRLTKTVGGLESVAEHFQRVELSDLRRTLSQETGIAGAEFSIILTTSGKAKG